MDKKLYELLGIGTLILGQYKVIIDMDEFDMYTQHEQQQIIRILSSIKDLHNYNCGDVIEVDNKYLNDLKIDDIDDVARIIYISFRF